MVGVSDQTIEENIQFLRILDLVAKNETPESLASLKEVYLERLADIEVRTALRKAFMPEVKIDSKHKNL